MDHLAANLEGRKLLVAMEYLLRRHAGEKITGIQLQLLLNQYMLPTDPVALSGAEIPHWASLVRRASLGVLSGKTQRCCQKLGESLKDALRQVDRLQAHLRVREAEARLLRNLLSFHVHLLRSNGAGTSDLDLRFLLAQEALSAGRATREEVLRVLGLSSSTWYYRKRHQTRKPLPRGSAREVPEALLAAHLWELVQQHPGPLQRRKGYRPLASHLRREGLHLNRKRVQALLPVVRGKLLPPVRDTRHLDLRDLGRAINLLHALGSNLNRVEVIRAELLRTGRTKRSIVFRKEGEEKPLLRQELAGREDVAGALSAWRQTLALVAPRSLVVLHQPMEPLFLRWEWVNEVLQDPAVFLSYAV